MMSAGGKEMTSPIDKVCPKCKKHLFSKVTWRTVVRGDQVTSVKNEKGHICKAETG